jgi:hypothetical protein
MGNITEMEEILMRILLLGSIKTAINEYWLHITICMIFHMKYIGLFCVRRISPAKNRH